MSTIRKFYIKDKVIIAPLKSATRWLIDRAWKHDWVDMEYLVEQTTESDYFLYREGVSHLESAILTDYLINEMDLSKTLHTLLSGESHHWCEDLYGYVHRAWCYNKFQMVNCTDVCDLIGDWNTDINMYDFSKHPPFITKRMVLDMIDTKTLTTLYKSADDNNYWLQQILNGNDAILSKSVVDKHILNMRKSGFEYELRKVNKLI
jgi:hypothetical protein